MSAAGLQRAQHVLNTIAQQFPSIAQAHDMGMPLHLFIYGTLQRSGLPPSLEVGKLVDGLADLIGTSTTAAPGGATVDDDALTNS